MVHKSRLITREVLATATLCVGHEERRIGQLIEAPRQYDHRFREFVYIIRKQVPVIGPLEVFTCGKIVLSMLTIPSVGWPEVGFLRN
jgi:hypothetical protein